MWVADGWSGGLSVGRSGGRSVGLGGGIVIQYRQVRPRVCGCGCGAHSPASQAWAVEVVSSPIAPRLGEQPRQRRRPEVSWFGPGVGEEGVKPSMDDDEPPTSLLFTRMVTADHFDFLGETEKARRARRCGPSRRGPSRAIRSGARRGSCHGLLASHVVADSGAMTLRPAEGLTCIAC